MTWKRKPRGATARARRRRRQWDRLFRLTEPATMERFVIELGRWLQVPIEPWFRIALAGKLGEEISKRLRENGQNPRLPGPRWRCDVGHEVRGYAFCHLCRFEISPVRPPESASPKEAAGTHPEAPCPTTPTP